MRFNNTGNLVQVTDNTFEGNVTTTGSGAGVFLYINEGGLTYSGNTHVNNIAQGGIEGRGAGAEINFKNGEGLITGNTFTSNQAGNNGGGLSVPCESATMTITENIFNANTAANVGGGLSYATVSGSLTLCRNTWYDNRASDGGGVYVYLDQNSAENILKNNILWNNAPNELAAASAAGPAELIMTYADVEDGTGKAWFGTGCIAADPLFTDPANGDFSLSWANAPVADGTKSPCIDAGDPSSPPDPDGSRADMGAVPYGASPGAPDKLYFPHVASNDKWETEIAIINKSGKALSGRLEACNSQGGMVSEKDLALSGNGRRALTIGDAFSSFEDIEYIIFSSDSANVCGYTKFYQEGLFRVAVPAVGEINTGEIYIPHIASNANWWTGLALVNTTDSRKVLDINFSNGETKQIALAPGEHDSFNIMSFFGGVSQPAIESAVITGGSGVIGLELFSKDKTLSGVLLKDDTTDTLYFPHVASNDKWWTGIAAYNPNRFDANLTVTPYTEGGQALDTLTVPIEAAGKYLGNAKGLSLPEDTAWLKIDSSQPLNGFELFGSTGATEANQWLAGYSAVGINRKEGVFPKLDRQGWTGIAFVNTSDTDTSVSLSLYDDEGFKIADETIDLAGYEKVVDSPENIFGGSIAAATYMRFSSGSDVVGFQLNGSNDGMMLDGLPGM